MYTQLLLFSPVKALRSVIIYYTLLKINVTDEPVKIILLKIEECHIITISTGFYSLCIANLVLTMNKNYM